MAEEFYRIKRLPPYIFAEVNRLKAKYRAEGMDIILMTGTADNLASRAGRVAALALEAAPFNAASVDGALVFYCAGCMLSIPDRMNEVVASLNDVLEKAPFLCAFTLGELGCFPEGENRHGNLMIAVLAFGPLDKEQP